MTTSRTMSQESNLSEPPSSQRTEGGTPAPTSKWRIWSRGINKDGDWNCTHRFEDNTQTYHYVNKSGTHYMKHRDGSATFVPNEGTYIPRGGRDKNTNIPAPTMEEITKEHEQIKEEYRQYLVRPVKYWNGVCQTRYHDISWFFPNCGCGDHMISSYDNDYPEWEGDYDYDDGYGYEMAYEGYGRSSEDEEEGDGEEDDGYHSEGEETGKEEALNGPVIMHLTPEPKEEGNSASPTPVATPESLATGGGKITSRGSGIGPDLETEAKRILRSHRSKPY